MKKLIIVVILASPFLPAAQETRRAVIHSTGNPAQELGPTATKSLTCMRSVHT
jgi:hypothetical protein